MDICLRYLIQKKSHPDQFKSVYDVVGDAAMVAAIANLEDTAYMTLTLPLVNIDETIFPEVEHWFEASEDSDFYSEPEIYGWDIDDLINDIKESIANPDADENRLVKYFPPLDKARKSEEYKARMTDLLAKIEPLADINYSLIMRHEVYYG